MKLRWSSAVLALVLALGFLVPAPATAATGDKITVVTGDYQSIFPSESFAPLVLKVINGSGQPIPNRSVLVEVLSGPGRLSGRTYERMLTGADGKVTLTTLKGTGATGAISFRATADSPSVYFTFHVADTVLRPDNGAKQVVVAGARFDSVTAHFGYSSGYTRSGVQVNFTASGAITFEGGGRTATGVTDTYGNASSPNIPAISGAGVGFVTATASGAPATAFTLKSVAKPVITATGSGQLIKSGQLGLLKIMATDEDGLPVARHRVTYRITSGAAAVSMIPVDGICTSSASGYSSLTLRTKAVTASTTATLQATSAVMSPVNFTVTVTP